MKQKKSNQRQKSHLKRNIKSIADLQSTIETLQAEQKLRLQRLEDQKIDLELEADAKNRENEQLAKNFENDKVSVAAADVVAPT